MGGFDDHNKEDAFSANHPISSSSFGLREAIHEAEMQRENDIQVQAQTLFNKMKVLQKVRKATKEGRREISINFPKTKRFGPDTSLKKGISGADVIIALMAMISEDDIFVKTKAGQTGGCCEEPEGVMVYACPDRHCSQVLCELSIDFHNKHFHRVYSCALCSSDKPREQHHYDTRPDLLHPSRRNPPMYKEKEDLLTHISRNHAYYCPSCNSYFGDVNGHLWAHHSEERRKGLFGKERVQTKTHRDMARTDPATLVKEWQYDRKFFSYAGEQCKNCGGDYESLSDEDYYLSMELTW